MFDNILFDFDGTIMDTSPGIYDSFDRVIAHYRLDFPRSQYSRMIGPPLNESFSKILKLPEDEIRNAIKIYRDYYSVEGMYNAEVYPGIVPLMENLRKAGKKIFTATSKPEVFTRKIIEQKNMTHLFDFIGGSDAEEKGRTDKKSLCCCLHKISAARFSYPETKNYEKNAKAFLLPLSLRDMSRLCL